MSQILILLCALLGLSQYDTPRVTVYYDQESDRSARGLALRAERILEDLEEKFGLVFEGKIVIYFAGSNREFNQFQPDGKKVPIWSAGVAYVTRNIIVLKSTRASPHTDLDRLLAHEISHLVLGRLFAGRRIPIWLNEGLTMHIANDWGPGRQWAMVRAVGAGRLIPLGELVYSFPDRTYDAQTAYAASYYFIAFIRDRYGVAALNRLVEHLSHGVQADRALKDITGRNLDDLEEAFDQWLRRRFSVFWIITNPGILWALAAIVLVIALLRQRRLSAKKLAEWEAEENEATDDTHRAGGSGSSAWSTGEVRSARRQRTGNPIRALPPEGSGDDPD
jgi:hypothetical protein